MRRRVYDRRPYLLLAVIILLWGSNYIVARVLTGVSPIRVSGVLYAFFRYLLGTVTMLVVILRQGKGFSRIRTEVRPYRSLLGLSAVLSAVFVVTTHMSAEHLPAGTTSLIVNLSPVVVLLFGVLFLHEPLSTSRVLGFLLGFAGGFLFLCASLTSSLGSDHGLELGLGLALAGMLSWAAYTIVLQYLERADCYIVMTAKHAVSTVIVLPFVAVLAYGGSPLILVIDVWSTAGLLFAGVFASGVAYVLYFRAVAQLGASRASSFLFLVPFVSIAGDFFLREPPTLLAILAGSVALVGVALVRRSGRQQAETLHDATSSQLT
ncbi:MAG: DMT family transporter [Candidatus Thorarchaeota archaeon]|nr:DMT family transporter [Candidatus Thorarchaeota archaeon]